MPPKGSIFLLKKTLFFFILLKFPATSTVLDLKQFKVSDFTYVLSFSSIFFPSFLTSTVLKLKQLRDQILHTLFFFHLRPKFSATSIVLNLKQLHYQILLSVKLFNCARQHCFRFRSEEMTDKLSEENANQKKHVGCINGILHQLFTHGHRGLPAGKKGEDAKEHTKLRGKNTEMDPKEKQRISSESSSTTSSSSSCSSAFSSVDSNKAAISSTNSLRYQKHQPLNQSEHFKTVGLSVRIHKSNTPTETVLFTRSLTPKDQHRLSCDGRETREKSVMTRFKELPRLSLDSRQNGSTKCESKNQEPESNKQSSSGVVAKLMGLEEFPETLSISTPKCSESHLELKSPLKIPSKDRKALEFFLDAMGKKTKISDFSNAERKSQRLGKHHNQKSEHMVPDRIKETPTTPKRIVIMKPTKTKSEKPVSKAIALGFKKEMVERQIGRIRSSKNDHFQDPFSTTGTKTLKTKQTPKGWPHSTKEDAHTRSPMSLGTKSPRLAHKVGLEKSFHHKNPSLVISTNRRPLNKQQQGAFSPPGRKNRSKPISSHQEDVYSQQFGQKKENMKKLLDEDGKMVAPIVAIQEQPSPVSVLDATFYRDISPSPVKKVLKSVYQDDAMDETWGSSDHHDLFQHTTPNVGLVINHKALETKKCIVQRQQKLYRNDEEPALHLGMNVNLDHGYIYDILSASNLLYEDLAPNYKSIQVHSSSGHTINPGLFLVLEQTKPKTRILKKSQKNINDKIHRKLIFDSVDEILNGKKALPGFSEGWYSTGSEQLLREVCSEMARNMDSGSKHEDEILKGIMWDDSGFQRDYQTEISKIVMDVERLIFKDLVAEIVKM